MITFCSFSWLHSLSTSDRLLSISMKVVPSQIFLTTGIFFCFMEFEKNQPFLLPQVLLTVLSWYFYMPSVYLNKFFKTQYHKMQFRKLFLSPVRVDNVVCYLQYLSLSCSSGDTQDMRIHWRWIFDYLTSFKITLDIVLKFPHDTSSNIPKK
jgi:hypothetical protein